LLPTTISTSSAAAPSLPPLLTSALLTSGCNTVDHSAASGDDRGPLAALNGYLVVGGDTGESAAEARSSMGVEDAPR
jgi:hypothetical protein